MKTIGIKLADGSFYPILEEGTAKTYQLDLTTVKDGQTKVQIDLYRSESGSMEDAQYVDTLEVSNLVPHPNGEADLHLSVALNEKNELDAKVIDEETGRKSETSVTLVSRTLAERANPANFELSEEQKDSAGQDKIDEIPEIAAGLDEPTFAEDDFAAETVEDSDFSEPEEDAQSEKPEELEFETVPFSFDSELENDVAEVDPDSKNDEPQAEGFKAEDEPAFDTKTDAPAEEKAESEEKSDDSNIVSEDFEIPDFDKTSEKTKDGKTKEADNFDAADNFELPEFPEDSLDSKTDDDFSGLKDNDFADLKNDDFSDLKSEDFELPDFDKTVTENSAKPEGLSGYFDDPAFKNDPVFNETNLDSTNNEIDFDTSALDSPVASASPAMDFSDLYDKETLDGKNNSYDEEEETEKKTRVPVIICVVCAIICVIATLLILFVVPSKYNLLKNHKEKESTEILSENNSQTEDSDIQQDIQNEEVAAEPEPAPEAVEDTVVVAPEPEVVVPVPPAPKPVEKAKDIKYRIRWGDTLWDISDAYYKNPWRYKKIARYNKIKDPDLIISGTDILIPVE
ncbi:MAG: LysM peptidoglycan-binding domain-containing protein [Treponema berlinense]|uniref:LysM peptidoglycan-binding domain-containing protein n=1 Tax=Treponema berlinense TaxID=225004 RepID=UPI002A83D48A|nr:LysM peptidoglycan-binding domain-containing protein [Treponema berlinense]MDY3708190.1 LysM peptidoglycan-binding domain-containing protein [Treponema berlinense]